MIKASIRFNAILPCGAILLSNAAAQAQILPDATLGQERSRIAPNVSGVDQIQGGAIRGSNLFHSFSQFNVGTGQQVYFANPSGVQNILTRVTGNISSTIDGTLGVAGTANLFLLNPNGIVFGQNARLDLRGSFLATTANAIAFGTQGDFSTTNPQAPALLTVQPSALLFSQIQTGQIEARSRLAVPEGQSLSLIGGDVNLKQAELVAPDGNLAIAGISQPERIELNGFAPEFSGSRANVTIAESKLDVAGRSGGSIEILAQNFDVTGSLLQGGITANAGDLSTQAGDINIEATGTTTLRQGSKIGTILEPGAIGNSGDVTLNTGALSITGGSQILTVVTGGIGIAGDITLNVQGASVLDGKDSGIASAIASIGIGGVGEGLAPAIALGTTGKVSLTTGSLTVSNSAALATLNTNAFGNASDVTVQARDHVVIQGAGSAVGNAGINGIGTSGDVTLSAGSLLVSDGAKLFSTVIGAGNRAGNLRIRVRDSIEADGINTGIASTAIAPFGLGESGDINIDARSLTVTNGAQITTLTGDLSQSGEKRGNITINTSGTGITLGNNGTIASGGVRANGGDITLTGNSIALDNQGGIFSIGLQGNAGDITLTGNSISLSNNSSIVSPSLGQGNAGKITIAATDQVSLDQSEIVANVASLTDATQFLNRTGSLAADSPEALDDAIEQIKEVFGRGGKSNDINVTARSLRLNRGFITSDTTSGGGGNIRLQLGESLILRQSSRISTTAGSLSTLNGTSDFLGGSGDGGNITIDSPLIVAVPDEISKIRANAFSGSGGKVNIFTQGLFGIQVQPQPTAQSDITASSQQGVQGSVSVAQPEVQPSQRITELPVDVLDASNQIAQVCPRGGTIGRFVMSGRGSAPPNPIDALNGTQALPPLAAIEQSRHQSQVTPRIESNASEIVEAQGWIKTRDGKVRLVAHMPETAPSIVAACPH